MGSQPKQTREDQLINGIIDWFTNWNRSYGKWAIIFFLGLSIYRTTTDGLWFIAFVVISFAYNFESHVKSGTPLIRERKANQSIREYGIGRAISTLIFPPIAIDLLPKTRKTSVMPFGMMYVFFGRAINTLLFLHLYVLFIIILDIIDREVLRGILIQCNQPVELLIDNWKGLNRLSSTLRVHNHSGLVAVFEHIYIVSLFSCAIYLAGIIKYVLRPAFFKGYTIHFSNVKKKHARQETKSLGIDFLTSPIGRFLFGAMMLCLLLWVASIYSPPVHFEGEKHARHGKYIWMTSYLYKDYFGYFTPLYMLSIQLMALIYGGVPMLEIPCRSVSLLLEKINPKKSN